MENPRAWRLPLLALGLVALLTGTWAGWIRLGWPLPAPAGWPLLHGPLMVNAFLGTLISLERAAALRARWPYWVPLVVGVGGLSPLTPLPRTLGLTLVALGGLGLVGLTVQLFRRRPTLPVAIMGLGALAWAGGNALWWLGWPIWRWVVLWMGFLVLTIAGERLELSRLRRLGPGPRWAFGVTVLVLVGGMGEALGTPNADPRVFGLGLLGLALWLIRYDLARRTVRQAGLPRFVALCLLVGYGWLAVAGAWGLGESSLPGNVGYDGLLHAVFLGFALSMIFGHAPLIFPALLGARMPFSGFFYAHWALLHLSLALRIGGDLGGWLPGPRWGGLLNGAAILLFLANTLASIVRGWRARPSGPTLNP